MYPEQDRGEDETERGRGWQKPAPPERREEIQQPKAVPDSDHSPQDEEVLAGGWGGVESLRRILHVHIILYSKVSL